MADDEIEMGRDAEHFSLLKGRRLRIISGDAERIALFGERFQKAQRIANRHKLALGSFHKERVDFISHGRMIGTAEEYIAELNPDARPEIFGQDYNPESYAICGSDMLIKGHSIEHIVFGDVLGDGALRGATRLYRFSITYLTLIFGAIALDALLPF